MYFSSYFGGNRKNVLFIVFWRKPSLGAPDINTFKVRFAVALKEEATKWRVFVSIKSCCFTAFWLYWLYWTYTCNSVIKSWKPINGWLNYCFLGKPRGDFSLRLWCCYDKDLCTKALVQKASLLTWEFKFHQWVMGVDKHGLWCTVCCLSRCQPTYSCFKGGTYLDSLICFFFLTVRPVCRSRALEIPFSK